MRGHKCLMYDDETSEVFWCDKEVCDNDSAWKEILLQHKKQLELCGKLISKGHKCVYVLKGYPGKVEWCGYFECTMTYYYTARIYYKRLLDKFF